MTSEKLPLSLYAISFLNYKLEGGQIKGDK